MLNGKESLEEIVEYFINLGFKQYNPPPIGQYSSCATCLQKAYKDDIGKKFFIDVNVFDFTFTDRISENYTIEYSGQYYHAGTHNAVNFTFLSWTLDEVENFINGLFDNGFLEYYETWENS